MNYGSSFIRVFRNKKVEEKLRIQAVPEEKIVTIEKDEIFFKDDKTKAFYKKYEKELNSFKMEDLKKIYDETGICIYRTIRYLKPKKNANERDIDIGGLCIQPTSVYYWGYDKYYNRHKYYRVAKEYKEKRRMLNKLRNKELKDDDDSYRKTGEYDEFFIDVEYLTFVDKLEKDDAGIYTVNDNQKEYVYPFKKTEKIEFTCDLELLNELIEKFGEDFICKKLDKDTFLAKMNVGSAKFKKWAFEHLESIDILNPNYLKLEIDKRR